MNKKTLYFWLQITIMFGLNAGFILLGVYYKKFTSAEPIIIVYCFIIACMFVSLAFIAIALRGLEQKLEAAGEGIGRLEKTFEQIRNLIE